MSEGTVIGKKGHQNKLNIKRKLIIEFVLLTFLLFLIGTSIIYVKQKRENTLLYFKKIEILNTTKKHEIENYFFQIQNQIKILSDYSIFSDATTELKPLFRTIAPSDFPALSNTEIENCKAELKKYYGDAYVNLLNSNSSIEYTTDDLYPEELKSQLLQYFFIVKNTNDFKGKKFFDKPINSGEYGNIHFKYNPKIRELAEKYAIDDIYLIDSETGYIIYSLNKNPDFATSLLSGPYRNSSLAKNFKETNNAALKKHVSISDLTFYEATGFQPVLFISSPLFIDGEKEAVLTFQIKADRIDHLLNWEQSFLGQTGEINIVGIDNMLRNNTRQMQETPKEFLTILEKGGITRDVINSISSNNSTTLLLTKDYTKDCYKIGLDDEKSIYKDYAKNKIHGVIENLSIPGLDWSIVTLQDKAEYNKTINRIRLLFLLMAILIIVTAFVISQYYLGQLIGRITIIRNAVNILSKGEKFKILHDNKKDEISEVISDLNKLNERIDSASKFTVNIGQGNFDFKFEPYSENDMLGVSLNKTKSLLEDAKQKELERAKEEKKRNWTTEGIAVFSDLLRRNNDNINKLSHSIVGKIVEYLDVNLCGIFLLNEEKNPPILLLSASYAYDRHKFQKKEIAFGEGLVGTCAKEKKTILLKEVPADYIQLTSGFGETKPKSLLIVPMIVEEKVMGVIEIGSMNMFEDHHIKFIENIGENIGSTLITAQINNKTAALLKESKVRSEEMAAQEEELRQNLEELQATQEEVRRQKDKTLENQEKIRAILDGTKDGIFTISDGIIDIANKAVSELTGFTDKELKGMNAFNILKFLKPEKIRFGEKMRQKAICKDKSKFMAEIIVSKLEDKEDTNNLLFFLRNIDAQVKQEQELIKSLEEAENEKNKATNAINEIKDKENELKRQNEEIQAQEEEMRQNLEEMQTIQEDLEKQKLLAKENEEKVIHILNGILDGILTVIDEKIESTNKSAASIFGYKENELIGMDIKTIFKFLKTDKIRQGEKMRQKAIRKDGSKFMAELIVTNTGSGMIYVTRNVDEQIRQEQELIKALESAEQLKNELKNKKK